MLDQTIVALATAMGESAVHIVKINGVDAKKIVSQCFKPVNEARWRMMDNFTLHLGDFYDGEVKMDQVLVSRMDAPHSYTGEDLYEINCHGGHLAARRIIETCIKNGAVLAEPGEFTKRAFLNGKLDLIQAEAVVDLVQAKTDLSADLALAQLDGSLSSEIEEMRLEVLDLLAYIEASIDFPEDEIDFIVNAELLRKVQAAKESANSILKDSKMGRIIRNGLSTAIVGKPNVGKSSLLNALLKEERAIVTEIPGTTRDEIREYVKIGEVLLHLIDTAGLRKSLDPVEALGIERTWKVLDFAELVLLVFDGKDLLESELSEEELTVIEKYKNQLIVLINKMDLLSDAQKRFIEDKVFEFAGTVILFSVKDKIGFEALEQAITDRVFEGKETSKRPLISNIRQIQALENCLSALEKALEAIYQKIPFDIISIDVRKALTEVSSITGHNAQQDVIERIFKNFCIGK